MGTKYELTHEHKLLELYGFEKLWEVNITHSFFKKCSLHIQQSRRMTRESITICLRVISIKFLLSISKLNKTMWSWKLTAWSQKMNLIDTSTNFLHYSYYKRIRTTNKNLNFDIRCLRVKNVFSLVLKMDQLPRNQRKESWRKRKEELEVSQRQAVSDIIFN